jgi:hypothetical protein
MLRDPDEIQVRTFDGLPVLSEHRQVGEELAPFVIGATGSRARLSDPYLFNDLTIWVQDAIDKIEDGSAADVSCGYRYRPQMKAGVFGGEPYDGIMRGITGHHVALVDRGRVRGAGL